jgi:signal transduction histidine kinase
MSVGDHPMFASFTLVWPFLATAIFTALLTFYTRKQPNRPGKRYFMLILFIWMIMALASAAEMSTDSGTIRYAALQVQIFCGMLTGPLLLFFTFEYTGHHHWLTPRRMALLLLPVIISQILALTNSLHQWTWIENGVRLDLPSLRGPAAHAGILYAYACWIAATIIFASTLLRARAFVAPILLIMVGQAVPRLVFLLAPEGMNGFSSLQLAILSSNLSILTYFFALFNFRLLRVQPVARDAVLERMDYSVIVLDAENRLVDFNPAVQTLPGVTGDLKTGHPMMQALPVWWQYLSPLKGKEAVTAEVILAPGKQVYEVHSLPLLHASGWHTGHIFILNDVTPAWRARQQIAQHQWNQATLQERQQLAQELHDGLSQNLAFLNLESQAAQVYLAAGQYENARQCLDRLVEELHQMQGNTREMIGDLMIVSSQIGDFLETLRQILINFEKHSGIHAVLKVEDEAESACCPEVLDSTMVVQLLRIVQEALTNIRKHAQKASQVYVRIWTQDRQMRLSIQDDGAGFEPSTVLPVQNKHFGLRIVRQRAARIGAQVTIQSAIGAGTIIELRIPMDGRKQHEYSPG